jgi:hypothetical protein
MERGLSYAEQADYCRRQAKRYQGKPEKPFLLRLAAEFEHLEQGRALPSDTRA